MGNRAVITAKNSNVGVYLYWNGGRDSVEAFCEYCRLKHYRSPAEDDAYAFARLAQVVGNYIGGELSVGVVNPSGYSAEYLDNGVYYIGEDWEIAGRDYPWPYFQEQARYELRCMLHDIDECQPTSERLEDFLDGRDVPTSTLKQGDSVWVFDHYRKFGDRYAAGYCLREVIGFGEGRVNGQDVTGVPYVDIFGDPSIEPSDNINCYLRENTYRIA